MPQYVYTCTMDHITAVWPRLVPLEPQFRPQNAEPRYKNLHDSLQKTANTSASPGHTCYPDNAGVFGGNPFYGGAAFRAYPEMFYSAALTAEQTDAMYVIG